ncbi:hypothetical protein [Teichococcus aestuarii]|uniref:hypothetical protein n=1 Tax=Teichococcus aestuarii TaxID=568898 RepID=UPI00361E2F23
MMASVAGWMWWRNRGLNGRFSALGLEVRPLAVRPAQPEGLLRFSLASPRGWQARQGTWCLELTRGRAAEAGWSLALRPARFTARHWPLAHAATLDGLLNLARRLATRPGLLLPEGAQEVTTWLEGDLEFVLPVAQQRIMALAEGGYALRNAAAGAPSRRRPRTPCWPRAVPFPQVAAEPARPPAMAGGRLKDQGVWGVRKASRRPAISCVTASAAGGSICAMIGPA